MPYHPHFDLHTFIVNALREDVGDGDHTSESTIPKGKQGEASLKVKENGTIAGVHLAKEIFKHINPNVKFEHYISDGKKVKKGDVVFKVTGDVRSILKSERLVLNCMQRMSGIATKTAAITAKLKGTNAKLLDTRKTTPGFRALEKYAVKIGGGTNHRYGLFDMILIKDNHVDFAGGISQAIEAAKKYIARTNRNLKIEVEARNLKEVNAILKVKGVHRIMLDNFSIPDLKKAVTLIGDRLETEASGNITIKNIRKVADCKVDFISVGALTHSYESLDLSLKASGKNK